MSDLIDPKSISLDAFARWWSGERRLPPIKTEKLEATGWDSMSVGRDKVYRRREVMLIPFEPASTPAHKMDQRDRTGVRWDGEGGDVAYG